MSALDELPARVANLESQILLFRDEVRNEFSAVRTEFSAEFSAVRTEMQAVRTEMQALIGGVHTEMRVLHEDLIDRIKLLGER